MRPCNVNISIEALHHNLSVVKQLAPESQVVAMVKANAYGHGLVKVSHSLSQHVAYLGVACIDEAIVLRRRGIQTPILLAEGFFSPEELNLVMYHDLATVVHTTWQLETILATQQAKPIDVWLKFDSGMHRLGFNRDDWRDAFDRLKQCDWVEPDIKCMTHFACADAIDKQSMNLQLKKFQAILPNQINLTISIANSAAVMSLKKTQLGGYVRPGLMLYGASPLEGQSASLLNLKPVMEVSSQIIALRHCQAGDSVGYSATWTAKQETLVATVAIGYGDGYPIHLAEGARVMIDGQSCAIIGRVSMDMMAVDVSELPSSKIGQKVLLWGESLPIDDVAAFSGSISYDLLCRAGLHNQRSPF